MYVGGSELFAINPANGQKLPWRSSPSHQLTAFVSAMAVSGDVLYLGGVTRVDGESRKDLAALDVSSGALKSWVARIDGRVTDINAIHPVDPSVYVGGNFDGHLAAFAAAR